MRDVSRVLSKKQNKARVIFELSSIAGVICETGEGDPVSTIQMDVLDFNIFASGRFSFDEARTKASITGDVQSGEQPLIIFLCCTRG